jgi:hypothetical protein
MLPVGLAWVWTRRAALADRRALMTGATAFAALMLVLALGRYAGVASLLVHLPVIGALRAPARYVVLMQFALMILAAIAVEDLLAICQGRREPPAGQSVLPWIPALLGVATTVCLNAGLLPFARQTAATVAAAAPGVAVIALVTLCVVLAARRTRWALPALVLITAADLGAYGIRFVYQEPARSIARLMVTVKPASGRPEDTYASAPDVGPYVKNLLVLRDYRLTTGYVGFFPAVRHPIGGERSLQLSGNRWWFTPEGFKRPWIGGAARARLIDEQGQDAAGKVQLTADRPGYPVRFRAKRANKTCSHGIRCAVNNHRPSGLAQLVKHRLQRNQSLFLYHYNSCCRLGDLLRSHSLCYPLARPLYAATHC